MPYPGKGFEVVQQQMICPGYGVARGWEIAGFGVPDPAAAPALFGFPDSPSACSRTGRATRCEPLTPSGGCRGIRKVLSRGRMYVLWKEWR